MTTPLPTSSLIAAQAYAAGPRKVSVPGGGKPFALETEQTAPDRGVRGSEPRSEGVRLDLSDAARRLLAERNGAGAPRDPGEANGAESADNPISSSAAEIGGVSPGQDLVSLSEPATTLPALSSGQREAPFAAQRLDTPPPAPPGTTLDLVI